MSGISLVMSKSCCPMYSFCTSNTVSFGTNNKINFGASNKIDLVSCRLSNLHLQRISPTVATKYMSEPRYVSGLRSEVPEVSGAVVSYVVLSVGIVGMALHKALEVVAHLISTRGWILGGLCTLLGLATVSDAIMILEDIACEFAVLHDRPFSVGDTIEVRHVKGQVIMMEHGITSWHIAEDARGSASTTWFYGQAIKNISRATTVVPYSLLCGKGLMNKSWVPYHAMVSKIYFDIEEDDKILEIIVEIRNMMKSNSNVYLGKCQPSCRLAVESGCDVVSLAYNLKQVSDEHQLHLAKQDVLLKSAQIMKKYGATVGGSRPHGELKSLSANK